ncbi:hypothetical protein SDC9_30631 [bioreactor metagenome]|uniref:Uncharacterized protein n=1 Tax=bioreactor metagenome TaxID=1076179 RepID=A0A644V017_9ZZZZ
MCGSYEPPERRIAVRSIPDCVESHAVSGLVHGKIGKFPIIRSLPGGDGDRNALVQGDQIQKHLLRRIDPIDLEAAIIFDRQNAANEGFDLGTWRGDGNEDPFVPHRGPTDSGHA